MARNWGVSKRKVVTLAALPSDERMKKSDADGHDQGDGDHRITILCPIERLYRRGVIVGREYGAGMEYRRLAYVSAFAGVSSASDYSKIRGTGINWDALPRSIEAADARIRYDEARKTLGSVCRSFCDAIILEDLGLEEMGDRIGLPRSEGIAVAKYMLKQGLKRLEKLFYN